MDDQKYASAIQDDEISLILSLPVWRKVRYQWSQTLVASLWLVASIFLLMRPAQPAETASCYVLAGVIFSLLAAHRLFVSFVGTETIEINREYIKVSSGIGLVKRSTVYQANNIHDLRCTSTTYLKKPSAASERLPRFSDYWKTVVDPRTSSIACDDQDGETIYLAGWINKSLARHFVSLVKERFPHYN